MLHFLQIQSAFGFADLMLYNYNLVFYRICIINAHRHSETVNWPMTISHAIIVRSQQTELIDRTWSHRMATHKNVNDCCCWANTTASSTPSLCVTFSRFLATLPNMIRDVIRMILFSPYPATHWLRMQAFKLYCQWRSMMLQLRKIFYRINYVIIANR